MKLLVFILLVMQLMTSAFAGYGFIHMREVDVENHQSNIALCALQRDYTVRMERAELFLKENPEGTGGISRSLVLRSITDYKRTLEALDVVDCD